MKKRTLYGRAVPYGPWSKPTADGQRFRIVGPGAFVPADPVLAHFHHTKDTLIGNVENGSLRLSDGPLGLGVEIDVPRTAEGRKAWQLVHDDYLTGMSFGMYVIDGRKVGRTNGIDDVDVYRFTLTEVSPTARPSFAGTWISTSPTPREGRDEIVRAAQAVMDVERRRRSAARQLQQVATIRAGLKR